MNSKEKAQLFMERFHGRQDVYGRAWTSSDGNVRGYAPVCTNHWVPSCHLRLKDGIGCAACEIKAYSPVAFESVLKHIRGEESQIQYVLMLDNNIKFGAIDFDCKPGKEDKGYKFDDVAKVLGLLREWKIPYGVARSTTAGFHVYFFFEKEYPAYKFRSFIIHLYERVGFMEQSRQSIRPIPEFFPKQAYGSVSGIGNGIKPPMIEPRFEQEKNCWVTDNNEMIPANLQWQHFAGIPNVTVEQMDKFLEENDVEIFEEEGTVTRAGRKSGVPGERSVSGKWQPPLTGSFEKVLEGCAAFKRIKDKCLKGGDLSHFEGFGLFHMAMHTADGVAWFDKNTKWGKNPRDKNQLLQSIDKNYSPWTCKKMQECSVCIPGTKCFNKKPPIELVEGQMTVRSDLPESQWPEPSPIRYAFGAGDDFLAKLIQEATDLAGEQDAVLQSQKLKEIVLRAQVFDDTQQDALKAHIEKLKLGKKRELNRLFDQAGREKTEELKQQAVQRDDIVMDGKKMFRKLQPHGVAVITKLKGNAEVEEVISTIDISIEGIKDVREEGVAKHTVYYGRAACEGAEYRFEIDVEKWRDNKEFDLFFAKMMNTRYRVRHEDIGNVRHAAEAFAKKCKVEAFYASHGWYGDAYLMPSVIVDKSGVRPNTEHKVDQSAPGKEHAAKLDFQLLAEDEFRDLMFHIKSDLLRAFPPEMIMTGLAHTLQPALMKHLEIKMRPVLYYEGITGAGKTKVTQILQWFWGNFPSILNLNTTGKSLMEYAHQFKDALLVCDDYKQMNQQQRQSVEQAIQYSYNETTRGALTKGGVQRGDKASRCLMMFSGELTPENEASMLARMILVGVEKRDNLATRPLVKECEKNQHKYSGITARFLSWFLNQDHLKIRQMIDDTNLEFLNGIRQAQNADRIAQNVAWNFSVWTLWVHFMLYCNTIDKKEADELIALHKCNAMMLINQLVTRCAEEQNGHVFIDVLKELLLSGKACVRNLEGFYNEKGTVIGWVKNQDQDPHTAYLFTNITRELVMSNTKSTTLRGTNSSFGAQFKAAGIISHHDEGKTQKTVRDENGSMHKVWAIDLGKLGLKRDIRTAGQTRPLPLDMPSQDDIM